MGFWLKKFLKVFTVIGAVAELERSLIKERVIMGLARAKAQGKRIGRPPTEVDEDAVHSFREAGLSLRAIGRKLGVSRTKIQKVLSRKPCHETPQDWSSATLKGEKRETAIKRRDALAKKMTPEQIAFAQRNATAASSVINEP